MPIEHNDFGSLDVGNAQEQALTRIGLKTLQVAQPLCPVGKYPQGSGKVGGNLRRSHKYKVNLAGNYVDVGVTAEYGGYVHNGTKRQRKQPWLLNAVEANKASIFEGGINAYEAGLGGGVK